MQEDKIDISELRNDFVERMIDDEINSAYVLYLKMKQETDNDAMTLLSFDAFFNLYREYARVFDGTVMVEESLKKTMRDEGVVSIDLDEIRRMSNEEVQG